MKYFLLFFFSWTTIETLFANTQFVSPFSVLVNFSIQDGLVLSNSKDAPEVAIKNQLKYMFGILNEVDSGVDFPQMKIEVISQIENEIHYKVSGKVAWSSQRALPRSFIFSLPKYGDVDGLTFFLNKYQKDCSKKPSSLESFWNYYRPHHDGCVISDEDIVKVSTEFDPSPSLNEKLIPDYLSIFQDNILEMTVIMTKDRPQDVNDVSFFDFGQLCGNLVEQVCHREIYQDGVKILLHVFLVNNFGEGPQAFLAKIENFLSTSDVISYNGHSGMGANIESWMKHYPVKDKTKYQIFFFNSCDTFGYFRNDFLEEGNRQVILNATPNYFGTFANSNLNLINKLTKSSGYNEILSSFPQEQHSLVLTKNKL